MKEKKSSIEKHTVTCPHCGKKALEHMTSCPHCKGELKSAYYDTANMDSPQRRKLRVLILAISLLAAVAIIVLKAVL